MCVINIYFEKKILYVSVLMLVFDVIIKVVGFNLMYLFLLLCGFKFIGWCVIILFFVIFFVYFLRNWIKYFFLWNFFLYCVNIIFKFEILKV